MSISATAENSILDLIFSVTSWAGFADASSVENQFGIGLHTADIPDADNDQASNEADFSGYARVLMARPGGFTAAVAGAVHPVTPIIFPASSSAGTTVSHWSIGRASDGTLLISGPIVPAIAVDDAGVTIRLLEATAVTLD